MSEFQKPYTEVGRLNHEIIFTKMSKRRRTLLKQKVNKLMKRKFYRDVND